MLCTDILVLLSGGLGIEVQGVTRFHLKFLVRLVKMWSAKRGVVAFPSMRVSYMTRQRDFSDLQSPISAESAVGSDLRTSADPLNLYRQVRDARSSARDREQRDDRGDERGPGDLSAIELWKKTSDLAVRYLQTTGKDLEVLAYLLEAEVRLYGLAGLAATIELATGLIRKYWGSLYPVADEDGFAATLLPLTRLNGEAIIYPMQRLPISGPSGAEVLRVWQSEQAQRIEALKRDNKYEEVTKQVSRGAWTIERVNDAVNSTNDEFFVGLSHDLLRVRKAFEELDSVCEQQVPEDVQPIFNRFHDGLKAVEAAARLSAGARWDAAMKVAHGAAGVGEGNLVADNATQSVQQPLPGSLKGPVVAVSGREQALQQLEEVALWFEKHEPQSLIPFEVRKVLRRGRMKPEQLYMELISDENTRQFFYRDLGMVLPEQSDQ